MLQKGELGGWLLFARGWGSRSFGRDLSEGYSGYPFPPEAEQLEYRYKPNPLQRVYDSWPPDTYAQPQ